MVNSCTASLANRIKDRIFVGKRVAGRRGEGDGKKGKKNKKKMEEGGEERLFFEDVLFPWVPRSYVICGGGEERREAAKREMREARPTKEVVFVTPDCTAMPVWATSTAMELWHTNRVLLLREEGEAVLVMEDDCRFGRRVGVGEARNIRDSLKSNEADAFSLGSTPILSRPTRRGLRLFYSGSAHAVLYSEEGRKKAARVPVTSRMGHDVAFSLHLRTLAPFLPIAFQPHEPTKNMRIWKVGGVKSFLFLRSYFGALNRFLTPYQIYVFHHIQGWVGGILVFHVACWTFALLLAMLIATRLGGE